MPLLLLLCMHGHAQFRNKAALEPVAKTGFYRIEVTPELSSYLKTDFSDLRIMDEGERQVPYVVKERVMMYYDTVFTKLSIISNKPGDSGRSTIVIKNEKDRMISSIGLVTRNNAVSRTIDISGSDDNNKWYSITENGTIEKRFTQGSDKYLQLISFPFSSYRYFRLTIYNGNHDPVNIISVGAYEDFQFGYTNPYTSNPNSIFRQVDSSDGNSYVWVHDAMQFHKTYLGLYVSGQKFFKRKATLIVGNGSTISFTINTDTTATAIPPFKANNWSIVIYNGDNPPLSVSKIVTSQQTKRITAWLDSGKTYHLEMNDSFAVAPVYDLQQFKDSIPNGVTELKYSNIQPVEIARPAAATGFFKQSWLWPVMIGVLVVLVLFTVKLTRDMSGKRT